MTFYDSETNSNIKGSFSGSCHTNVTIQEMHIGHCTVILLTFARHKTM